MFIDHIHAREILDSRGNPTVEVDVFTEGGFGRASVPSGASTGTNEALELRDKDKRYLGKGVMKAVNNVNTEIREALLGMDVRDQREIDATMLELDGTENKSKLGANAILAVSLSVAHAAADSLGISLYRYLGGTNAFTLPVPTMNVINGGKHAGNELAIQEFMLQPSGAKTFSEALRMGAETYHTLGAILVKKYGNSAVNVGYEGGYAPPLKNTTDALDALTDAIEEAGYNKKITIGLDSAATEFYKDGKYKVDGRILSSGELIDFYAELVDTYPILSIEDPFEEESFEDFAKLTKKLKDTIIIGDDLFVTNVKRLEQGIRMNAGNALLLKVNQIGTLSEAFDAARLAQKNKFKVVVSHRSAETEDTTIADISVAIGAELIKTGAPARSERNAKYNQLLRIEEELGKAGRFVGV
ncbi:MAG: phosphopyruvate hydratase [Candidatus Methanoperedens nitroreducens]|uniref:Enolase n=1 Tax=Candidatus Methanoperedens nitratireducens TaxID=1392998 RepID=A0A0P8AA19_9EURY|nr:phosphopyruvate hydratase [Candidatus Methanoperedens sp. BLZ2]KAB2948079.1 MAG: phosphopyruvate hydratase [Candidatus Methanoperedens sp.]KPQ43476.1 MAG: phosphopyruvate hydratase [Candidatus Methanoperedens sp. BLZ1]MBZ0173882.1 phosphopyruvate hydratase [Candidatus Methanoperedens nitroreducens]MCX9080150.1 phosphopyruvate hydratase [Candidatus Methanoperedens sp.]